MKRKLINQLLEWKELSQKQPIFLTGGKGVGKTYLLLDFAKTFYQNYIYINYELNVNSMGKSHSKSISTNSILEYILQMDSPNPVLLVLDEVSFFNEFESVLNILKTKEQLDIIIVSSMKLVHYKEDYLTLTLYPLDFEEFLLAINKEWYISVIKEHYNSNKKIPDIVHSELLKLCEGYLRIGGMPLVVNEYINTETELNIPQIHKLIFNSYVSDITFDNMEAGGTKISQILKTLPTQLAKSNKKFQYSLLRKGATKNLYMDAMEYIKNTYYALDCYRMDDDLETSIHFKLYLFDLGILHSIAKESELEITTHFRKGLIENFIALHLIANGYTLKFWESESSSKIEFIINKNNKVLPIEVRVDNNTRSKNISMFRTKYSNSCEAVKISTRNFSFENHIKYVPLYAVFCL